MAHLFQPADMLRMSFWLRLAMLAVHYKASPSMCADETSFGKCGVIDWQIF